MALPELYQEKEFQRQTFDRNSEFIKRNPNLTARGTRKFNRYWNSDQRLKDEKAFNEAQDAAEAAFVQEEIAKRAASWDARLAAVKQQNAERGAAALKQINASLAAKPVTPVAPATPALVLKDAAHWNQVASQYGFKDYNAVAAWQKENGLEADGKFGSDSYAKWAELNPDKVGSVPVIKPRTATPTQKPKSDAVVPQVDSSSPEFVGPVPKSDTPVETPAETPKQTTPAFDINAFAEHYMMPILTVGNKKYVRYDPQGLGDFYVDDSGKLYKYGSSGKVGSYLEEPTSIRFDGKGSTEMGAYRKIKEFYRKQGGTMNRINYFQQGGAAPQQQDVKAQVTALVQAAMQGDQKATETVNKIMEAAKAGDQQALQLAQMIQEVAKQMQGQATAAKWGAKLGYVRSLKYAKGGKTCPECEKKVEMKACGGKKAKKKYFGGLI